jgi:hypothetical protein
VQLEPLEVELLEVELLEVELLELLVLLEEREEPPCPTELDAPLPVPDTGPLEHAAKAPKARVESKARRINGGEVVMAGTQARLVP